ncbi:hypothetical protein BJY04DRAFT_83146 [Aspergillus karnatakaensis]|uniref:uncharacterized protein n=1 Tax=Aspergillus karnatakaensis TaxID=1810916 RepID=UPI003CCE3204
MPRASLSIPKSDYSIPILFLHGSIGLDCIGIAMNPKQKTAIIVVALVLVPIILVCCAFALALGCAEFWSSGRFTLVIPWIRRRSAAVRRGLTPIDPNDTRAIERMTGHPVTSDTRPAGVMVEV